MNARELLRECLEGIGADGLCNPDCDGDGCSCPLDDLVPCEQLNADQCVAGRLVPCDEDCEECDILHDNKHHMEPFDDVEL